MTLSNPRYTSGADSDRHFIFIFCTFPSVLILIDMLKHTGRQQALFQGTSQFPCILFYLAQHSLSYHHNAVIHFHVK